MAEKTAPQAQEAWKKGSLGALQAEGLRRGEEGVLQMRLRSCVFRNGIRQKQVDTFLTERLPGCKEGCLGVSSGLRRL
jgi:hypothetical protein